MHCFDEVTEMPVATHVKTYTHIFAEHFLRNKSYLIFVAVYRECNKLTVSTML